MHSNLERYTTYKLAIPTNFAERAIMLEGLLLGTSTYLNRKYFVFAIDNQDTENVFLQTRLSIGCTYETIEEKVYGTLAKDSPELYLFYEEIYNLLYSSKVAIYGNRYYWCEEDDNVIEALFPFNLIINELSQEINESV